MVGKSADQSSGGWGHWDDPGPEAPTNPAKRGNPPWPKREKSVEQSSGGWGGWGGWDNPVPEPAPQPANAGPHRWPKREKRVWPKVRAATKGESDGGVDFRSISNGDPDYDVKKLMDWNGNWMPPPVEWSARNSFTDRHFGASIEKWMEGHDEGIRPGRLDMAEHLHSTAYKGEQVEGDVVVDGKVVSSRFINKELAPRVWIPLKIEGDAPHLFWRSLTERAPPALSDADITEHKPYWEAFGINASNCFLTPVPVLEAELDENDPENQVPGARMSCAERLAALAQRNDRRKQRIHEKRSRPLPPLVGAPFPPPDHLNLDANIFIRPFCRDDIEQIRVR